MEPAPGGLVTATFFFFERLALLTHHRFFIAFRRLISKTDGSKRAIPLAESGDAEVSRRRRETSIPWEQRTTFFVFGHSWSHRRRKRRTPRAQVLGEVKSHSPSPYYLEDETTATVSRGGGGPKSFRVK